MAGLLVLHLLEDRVELVQALFPEAAKVFRPGGDGLDGRGAVGADAFAATLLFDDDVRADQASDVACPAGRAGRGSFLSAHRRDAPGTDPSWHGVR